MIENIKYKKKLLAMIVRKSFKKKKGVTFFTPDNLNLQCGYMNHKKNYLIKPHQHLLRKNKIFYTSEVLYIIKGKLRVDFYQNKKNYLFSRIINKNEILILISGSHGFKTLSNLEMLEIKQGPFNEKSDKIKFNSVAEKNINFRKLYSKF
jgi:hypothetical protein